MAKNTGMARKLVIITVMVVFMFMAIVVEASKHVDKKCFRKYCRPGKYSSPCAAFCLRKCQVNDSKALDDCTFSCANSKCNNFTNDDNSQIEDIAPTISEQPDTNQGSQQVIDLPLIMGDLVADFVYNQEPISDPLTVENHDISTQLPITQIDHDPAGEIFTDLQIKIASEHAMLQPHNIESQSRNMESLESNSLVSQPIRQRKAPSYLQDYATIATKESFSPSPSEPKTLKSALKDPH
ncbi:hypothetical protein LWI29_023823 [Acer saccharum]|uniref:Uncharacterized protein n=1 Tax=Acer saccharum TaxID=4024 RepID=A0AA39SWV3_ACESA|nr:hypothetical protein LWI29_023823 [Acer saccharum]